MLDFIRNHKVGVGAGGVVAVAALAWLAFGYFGVHLLVIDEKVSEAVPIFDASATPADSADLPLPGASAGAPATDESTDTTNDAANDTRAPDTPPEADNGAARRPAGQEIVTEYSGTFASDAHPTSGTARVLGNGTGQRFLRFEDFETDNGPDLNVYLVNSSTGDVSDFVDLGDLKGNIGEQNYEIPDDVDLGVYDRVVIWCVRFGVGFGDADLMPI